jgi:uncharacterized protein (DUF305 family)
MSGRIKLLQNGVPINPTSDPPLGYEYEVADNAFDQACGTWGLNDFQLPNDQCPERFVCRSDDQSTPEFTRNSGNQSSTIEGFARCIDAMDCHMMAQMTTGASTNSEAALFVHQMVPHHQNAVNMAKALLKTQTLICDDLTDEVAPDCVLERVLRSIIVDQNHQIQLMRGFLESKGYKATDECVVNISTTSKNNLTSAGQFEDSSKEKASSSYQRWTTVWAGAMGSMTLLLWAY